MKNLKSVNAENLWKLKVYEKTEILLNWKFVENRKFVKLKFFKNQKFIKLKVLNLKELKF